jgi:hypothetical protein
VHGLAAQGTEEFKLEESFLEPGSHHLEDKSRNVFHSQATQTRGRLYHEGGKTRFISNDLWAALSDEVSNQNP